MNHPAKVTADLSFIATNQEWTPDAGTKRRIVLIGEGAQVTLDLPQDLTRWAPRSKWRMTLEEL